MKFDFRKFDFRAQVTRFFTFLQTRLQTKVSAIQSAGSRVLTNARAKVSAVQSSSELLLQSGFRALRLRLSAFTKLNPQSMMLRLLALAAAALMTVLVIGGIQTITRKIGASEVPDKPPQTAKPAASPTPPNWAGLPVAPSPPAPSVQKSAQAKPASPPAPQPKTTQASPSAKPASPAATRPQVSPQPSTQPTSPVPIPIIQSSLGGFAPRQEAALAHPTNYGDRYAKDIFGKPVENDPLVVLHETVWTADSAINTVRTPHYNEDDQSSYHSIIRLDGTIVYVVPPEKRAFGAGNSVFKSAKGPETVKTHKAFPPSVNNFAYHISLETPADGHNDAPTHSGYTDAQYRSLAWLVAHTSVTDDRVTTHRAIDQSGSRIDPRSFDATKFYTYLRALPRPGLAASTGS